MTILENKKTQIENGKDSEKEFADYKFLITVLLDAPPPEGGFTSSEIRKRKRIEKAINAPIVKDGVEFFQFEDADTEKLKQLESVIMWSKRDDDFLTFGDDIQNLKPE